MSKVLVNESSLTNIANAIRSKNGTQTTYTPAQMSSAINNISGRAQPAWVSFNATDNSYAQALTSLDVSWLDTSNMTNMSRMFYQCQSLPSLDLSSFNTANVTKMDYMFSHCQTLATLDLSNFDFSKVTSYTNIFNYCGTSTTTGLTTVYVKDTAAQNWILNLSSSDRPSSWSTDNVIVKS